jgi:hypothetical protein
MEQNTVQDFLRPMSSSILWAIKNFGIDTSNDLFWFIAIDVACSCVPEQDFPFQVHTNDRVFCRGFENVRDEINGFARSMNNRVIKKL